MAYQVALKGLASLGLGVTLLGASGCMLPALSERLERSPLYFVGKPLNRAASEEYVSFERLRAQAQVELDLQERRGDPIPYDVAVKSRYGTLFEVPPRDTTTSLSRESDAFELVRFKLGK